MVRFEISFAVILNAVMFDAVIVPAAMLLPVMVLPAMLLPVMVALPIFVPVMVALAISSAVMDKSFMTPPSIAPPVIVILDAVTAPAFVTRKGALAAVALPIHSRYVASVASSFTMSFDVPRVR